MNQSALFVLVALLSSTLSVHSGFAEVSRPAQVEARVGVETIPRMSDDLTEPLTIERVTSFLRSHPEIDSIENFIPRLPPSFRFRRVFAFDSRSRQAATPSHPRIILTSADASFVLSVTGSRTGRGSSEIEMMQFKAGDTMGFQVASYSFERNDRSGEVQGFSGINPARCLECHARNGSVRPFWEPYNLWVGFYGQENHSSFTGREALFFQQFQNTLKQEPGRYTSLFENPATVTSAIVHRIHENSSQKGRDESSQDEGSNLRRLNAGFNFFNFMRIHNSLRRRPFYARIKFALLAALSGCDATHRIDTFIPASL